MRILAIEDEAIIAMRTERMVREILGQKLTSYTKIEDLNEARIFLASNPIDLLFLDLNLNGENGFDILAEITSQAFHTVIISAHGDRAIEAFEFGVLDFIPKPFEQSRLTMALARSLGELATSQSPKYLQVKQKGKLLVVRIREVLYFKGADIYSEIHMITGEIFLHDKSLEKLSQLLFPSFERIHKSYLVATKSIKCIIYKDGGSVFAELNNGIQLPVGRTRYGALKQRFNNTK